MVKKSATIPNYRKYRIKTSLPMRL